MSDIIKLNFGIDLHDLASKDYYRLSNDRQDMLSCIGIETKESFVSTHLGFSLLSAYNHGENSLGLHYVEKFGCLIYSIKQLGSRIVITILRIFEGSYNFMKEFIKR